MIEKCNCKHEEQDKIHGKGNRVHNPRKKEGERTCTVCKTIKK